MKRHLIVSLGLVALATGLSQSAGAFGFGMAQHDYYPPPPWVAPYGAYPPGQQVPQGPQGRPVTPGGMPPYPYGPPPGARNVRGMWGGGPGMSWGPGRKKLEQWYREIRNRKPDWVLTKDWQYRSPYAEEQQGQGQGERR